jgi:hypothetical protein
MLESSANFTGVKPILEDLLEPPNMFNVQKSFDYLHYSGKKLELTLILGIIMALNFIPIQVITLSKPLTGMISLPNDLGDLTTVGRLTGQLPVDLQLGRLISYGKSGYDRVIFFRS